MKTRTIARSIPSLLLTVAFLLPWAQSQQTSQTQPPAQTLKPDQNPALINVHIVYGFAGVRKLDMGVYTNAQGKGKFTGIPATVRKPPLELRATKSAPQGTLTGTATMNPALECQAKRDIVLQKSQ